MLLQTPGKAPGPVDRAVVHPWPEQQLGAGAVHLGKPSLLCLWVAMSHHKALPVRLQSSAGMPKRNLGRRLPVSGISQLEIGDVNAGEVVPYIDVLRNHFERRLSITDVPAPCVPPPAISTAR